MRDTRDHVLLAIELKMSSSESRQGRQLTDREKQALLEVLTRAGLPHLEDAFLREKVRIVIISYGGPGPHFLCETIARYLCNEPVTTPQLDVPDYEVRERIEKVRVYNVYILIETIILD